MFKSGVKTPLLLRGSYKIGVKTLLAFRVGVKIRGQFSGYSENCGHSLCIFGGTLKIGAKTPLLKIGAKTPLVLGVAQKIGVKTPFYILL